MTKLAQFDAETGAIIGFYLDGFHQNIPEPTAPIADQDWQAHVDGITHFRVDTASQTVQPYTPAPPSHEDQRKAALSRIDQDHADFLVTLTGGATLAERDTWAIKEDAARAFEADTATAAQIAMLAAEALGAGVTEAELATTIIAKADTFLSLVGVAAGLRAKCRAAIMVATDETVPLDQVAAQIEAVFVQFAQEAQATLVSHTTEV